MRSLFVPSLITVEVGRDTGYSITRTLTGAAGRKLHFQFPTNRFSYLATLGPAISRDGGATWRWLNPDGTRHEPGNAFDYTFGADENETRFAVSIPYTQKNWDAAAVRWRGRFGFAPAFSGGRNIRIMAPKYPLEYVNQIEKTCADKEKISAFYSQFISKEET